MSLQAKLAEARIAAKIQALSDYYTLSGAQKADLPAKALAYAEDLCGVDERDVDDALVRVRRQDGPFPSLNRIWGALNEVRRERGGADQGPAIEGPGGDRPMLRENWPEHIERTARIVRDRCANLGIDIRDVSELRVEMEAPRLYALPIDEFRFQVEGLVALVQRPAKGPLGAALGRVVRPGA